MKTGKVGLSYFEKNTPYANFTPNDAEFDVRKQYNDVESDDMTYEALLDREICLMGLNYI